MMGLFAFTAGHGNRCKVFENVATGQVDCANPCVLHGKVELTDHPLLATFKDGSRFVYESGVERYHTPMNGNLPLDIPAEHPVVGTALTFITPVVKMLAEWVSLKTVNEQMPNP